MTETEENPCLTCSIRKMSYEGCCTENVGFGLKLVTLPNGNRASVCNNLETDPDTNENFCLDYSNRPDECRQFECDLVQNQRL